ncbi:MAG TPA: molybdopterin-guanine dinucleotide biosynthesis protein MobB [Thermoanaerobaculia bacterium]|nr:molybdopterin-guanine dinucleotide biosynthesis protein MobB [Thermoanaerobaculia bacterium]
MKRSPVAFVGESESGKTTLICRLIPLFVSRGDSVAVLKHTHHEANDRRVGDTERFLLAGAIESVLADDFKAVHFDAEGTSSWAYSHPTDLLRLINASITLVEGFKGYAGWPKLLIRTASPLTAFHSVQNVVALVSDESLDSALPRFNRDALSELLIFLDRISRP